MNTMKKRGCQILVLFMTAGMLTGCGDGTPKLEDALKKTASYEMKTVEDPASDALGGEWTVMALARSGEEVDENYFEKYRANVEKRVKEQEGVLKRKSIYRVFQGSSCTESPSGKIRQILADMILRSRWKILIP